MEKARQNPYFSTNSTMHVMDAPNIDIKVLYDLLTSMTNNSVDKVK